MNFGLLIVGSAIAITTVAAGVVGVGILSIAANGAAPSLGALVSCAPTLPDDDDEESDSAETETKT